MDSGMEGENVWRHKNLETNGKGRWVEGKIQILNLKMRIVILYLPMVLLELGRKPLELSVSCLERHCMLQ